MTTSDQLTIGFAQVAPSWLNREQTLAKVINWIQRAGEQGCQLLALGEALVPGYPFWIGYTDGAVFESPRQKEIFAHYARQAVQIEAGHLDGVRQAAAEQHMAVYLGCIERPLDRGGHSLYASLVYVDPQGQIGSVHRKLMPTYEERLAWSPGDGHGLQVHPLGPFLVGGLNCWENWMPLPRAALYAQGEDLHVAVWPGSRRDLEDATRFIAKEARSYVLSVSGLMRRQDIPGDTPYREELLDAFPALVADGGSCLAGPDGSWVIEPVVGEEALCVATIDHRRVREERHNFDPVGHYARPDVTRLMVNRTRQSTVGWEENG